MKKIYCLILLLAVATVGFAQECTDANVLSLPGKWKPGTKGASDHAAADMVKEKLIIDEVLQFIRTNLKWAPVGGDITFNGVYSVSGQDYRPAPVIKICNSYYAGVYFQHYYCGNGKIGREDFSIHLRTQFNELPFTFSESFFVSPKNKEGYDTQQDPGTDRYGFIETLPVEQNGYIDFTEGAGKTFRYRCRILTRAGQLPYSIVSKKEYYEKWKIKHEKAIAGLRQNIAAIAKQEKELGNHDVSNTCLQAIALYQSYIKQIDDLLQSGSAAALAAPALGGEENGAYYSSNPKENPKLYVVKPNLLYYNNQLPKYSPQVITISLRYAVNEDNSGKEKYTDEIFFKALEHSNMIGLLTEKLKPVVVQ